MDVVCVNALLSVQFEIDEIENAVKLRMSQIVRTVQVSSSRE